ncbi:lytic transglycosylase domain-containing protein [bacterium]|nr:lytic transglycosylase domain-containing protein [bacterium]
MGACSTNSGIPQTKIDVHSARSPSSVQPVEDSNSTYFSGKKGRDKPAQSTPVAANKTSEEQSITVSLSQVAKELNMSVTELRVQAHELNNFIALGRYPNKSTCPRNMRSDRSLCRLIKEYKEPVAQSANEDEEPMPNTRYSGGIVPIRPQHFAQQQRMHYERLMKSIARQPADRVLAWVPRMTKNTGCPRNLSAAAIRKLENLLPDRRARLAMEKLYDHASICLQPKDAGYHPTHFRQALLRNLWGRSKEARASINRAALSRMNGLTEARTLYWAGKLQVRKTARNQYWKKLVVTHPLTHHALQVWSKMSVDPHQIFSSRPVHELQRSAHNGNPHLDIALRWLEALYLIDKKSGAQRLGNWIMEKYADNMSASNMMYVSAMKSSQNTPLNAIIFLTRRAKADPNFINDQTLRMLFPRPYLEVFAKHSGDLDTFLLMSIARQESGFNPKAKSHANAQGLLQLLPSTARQLAGGRNQNLYNKHTNVRLGVKYLDKQIKRFNSVELALAAYNAGPSRVPTWKRRYPTKDVELFMDLIPFKETRNYVSLIVRNNFWYEKLYRKDVDSLKYEKGRKTRSFLVGQLLRSNSGKATF